MIYETQEQLDAAIVQWKAILRLQDWDIVGKIVRAEHLSDANHSAEVSVMLGNKQGAIKLRDPIDWPSDQEWPIDHEKHLVHEMLHLYEKAITNRLSDEQAELVYYDCEQIVECLATAFVALKRQISF